MSEILRVDVAGGKYTVVQDEGGALRALRHGQEWRDCCGDNLIYYLASELEDARRRIAELEKELEAEQDRGWEQSEQR